nr:hypothetical protein [Tanacetum cinerariifolium]
MQMQSPSLQNPPKSSSQPKGEHIKKDKGKKTMSSEEAEKKSTNINYDDDETHLTCSMIESSKIKEVKKFDFFIEGGNHIHLTQEEINHQKKIKEDAIAEAAKRESEVRKEELVDLLSLKVVNKYYNDKLQYDRYCDKMLNRIAESRITNCDVLTKKGLITLKVYREDEAPHCLVAELNDVSTGLVARSGVISNGMVGIFIFHRDFKPEPLVGLIYQNTQHKKRYTNPQEICKFCDYMLMKLLEDVKVTNLNNEIGFVDPPLIETNRKWMKTYELKISIYLNFGEEMKRYESYVGRKTD